MSKTNYQSMTVDELFSVLQEAAIKAHEVYVAGDPIEKQHAWVDILTSAYEEIQTRGDDALQRYIPLLEAPHPAVRLSAALGAQDVALELAVPVLEDLSDGKYGGTIGVNAGMTLDGMRKRGLLPPEKSGTRA